MSDVTGPQPSKRIPPVVDPGADVGQLLIRIVGETGVVEDRGGGFRIAVYHALAFPWDEVFKTVLYRDYKVAVTRHKADLIIEASL